MDDSFLRSVVKPPPGTPEPTKEERLRELLRHDRAKLEEELLVFRTIDDIARVRKKASRYKKNASSRRIMVGDGEDNVIEWYHGFDIIDRIHALLRHRELFATAGVSDIYFAPFTAGLLHVKPIRNVDLRFPDLVPSLENAGALETRGYIFGGGAPGGNGYFFKIYVNAAIYLDVVDELWILRDRLADFIRRRVLASQHRCCVMISSINTNETLISSNIPNE